MAFGKPNNPPKRNTVFGITDSLMDSVRDMYKSPAEKVVDVLNESSRYHKDEKD